MMSLLFFLWVLTLPFYQFSIVGSFSVDNLLAPLLLVIWIINFAVRGHTIPLYKVRNISQTIAIALVYLLSHMIGLIFTQTAAFTSSYNIASKMLYFILPVLYLITAKDLSRFKNAIIIVTIIASITALLSALGLMQFDFLRQAESRIGSEYLVKSIGVIGTYGDVGILMSLSLLLVIAGRRDQILFGHGSTLKIVFVIAICLIGMASMQSRNMLLTIIVALSSYWILGRWMKTSRLWFNKLYVSIFVTIFFAALTISIFYEPLLTFAQSIGGTHEAAGTIEDRLSQYRFMWGLINDRLLIGVDPDVYERYEHEISLIHNMWLKELVQGGIITVLTMFLVWWNALIMQVKNYQRGLVVHEPRVFISILLAMLVSTQFYPGGTLIFWVILGACTAIIASHANRSSK